MILVFFRPNLKSNDKKKIHRFVSDFLSIDSNYSSRNDIFVEIQKNLTLYKNLDMQKRSFILKDKMKIFFDNLIEIKSRRTNMIHKKLFFINYTDINSYLKYCFINKDDNWHNKKNFLLFLASHGYIRISNSSNYRYIGDDLHDKVFCIEGIYRTISSYL